MSDTKRISVVIDMKTITKMSEQNLTPTEAVRNELGGIKYKMEIL